MMLAGLIKDSVRQNINGTPGLKELPVLGGNLFRSRDYVQNETEMVVIVTPFIVGAAGQSDFGHADRWPQRPHRWSGSDVGPSEQTLRRARRHPDRHLHRQRRPYRGMMVEKNMKPEFSHQASPARAHSVQPAGGCTQDEMTSETFVPFPGSEVSHRGGQWPGHSLGAVQRCAAA